MASLAFAAPARFGRDSEAGVDCAAPLGGSSAPVAGAGAVAEAGGDSGAAGAVAEAGGDTGGAGAVAEVGGAPDCIARERRHWGSNRGPQSLKVNVLLLFLLMI